MGQFARDTAVTRVDENHWRGALCQVELLRTGRNITHAALKMFQQGELKLQVTAAYTSLNRLQGESWSGKPRPPAPPWEECTPSGQEKVEFYRERVPAERVPWRVEDS
jgi:hypothetical protein